MSQTKEMLDQFKQEVQAIRDQEPDVRFDIKDERGNTVLNAQAFGEFIKLTVMGEKLQAIRFISANLFNLTVIKHQN
ncbi:hypothetical protein [Levilactobacillus bambusae]|uniref:Uncharacterized protein n=1 Tax=Levilactobacillus bambusae TaxID=2024736 RepID=A0A2V1N1E9_9LACO|nr:hypothetical protein [Levilactobacillus bambusae]PWG01099.1 hypothetical protein DCM90_02685 [Levilactobacillus bambusae]